MRSQKVAKAREYEACHGIYSAIVDVRRFLRFRFTAELLIPSQLLGLLPAPEMYEDIEQVCSLSHYSRLL
jgi:hypothetical protein